MIRAALLNLYNGEDNRGMPMLRSLLGEFAHELSFREFDVRVNHEVADLSYDIYIFSGGPGDPLEDDKPWVAPFRQLILDLWAYNEDSTNRPKHVFFICHSFQIAMHCYQLGLVTERAAMSFGTYPVHKTFYGRTESLFQPLPDPFYIADFRRYQVVQPNKRQFAEMGAKILCLEKLRPHVHYERAIMAVRFSETMIGTQFHPEANPEGMYEHFLKPERREAVVREHGASRYERMMRDLRHPQKIELTFRTIIPGFIAGAIAALKGETALELVQPSVLGTL
jgi:homoserine O-succinyltransferase/O-acetyltransferase